MSIFNNNTQGNRYSMFSSRLDTSAMPKAFMNGANRDSFITARENAAAAQGIGPFFNRPAVEKVIPHVVKALMENVVPVSSQGFSAAPAAA